MTVTLPHTFTNGTPADAVEVMANLNALKAAVETLQAQMLLAIDGTAGQRVVSGTISSAGGISSGDSLLFSVVRNSAGSYTVTYATPFASTPRVVVSRVGVSWTFEPGLNTPGSASSFTCETRDSTNTLVDGSWTFIALGSA